MKIYEGIKVLELPFEGSKIHPVLFYDDGAVVLVDTGILGQFQEIYDTMDAVSITYSKLNNIILTHQDHDHIGGLAELLRKSEQEIKVIAHKEEKEYIEGKKRLIKMTPERLAEMFKALPESQRKAEEINFLKSLESKVQQTVSDGELLPFCGGITVIHTPGHTPGHICLYHKKSKTLLTGDALNRVEGQLVGPKPIFTADMNMAKNSVRKLSEYDIETAICYHGGVCTDNVNKQIRELGK